LEKLCKSTDLRSFSILMVLQGIPIILPRINKNKKPLKANPRRLHLQEGLTEENNYSVLRSKQIYAGGDTTYAAEKMSPYTC